ncbi:hypothetical protein N9383_06620, partial [Granulosicoccus sp.]|nr:hypothetical protein [Granulosicoccus sp.]
MTPDEVMEKMAQLYDVPKERFEGLNKSLFIMKEPYVLFKQVDEKVAQTHVQKLTKIGLTCSLGDEFEGLSLVPVTKDEPADATCPACNQTAGNGEICQSCGVIMHKYLKQKLFDDQFRIASNAAVSTDDKMKRLNEQRAKEQRAKKQKKPGSAKQTNVEDDSPQSSVDTDKLSVHSNEKTSHWVYAAVITVCLVIPGTGYVVHGLFNNPQVDDGLMAESDVNVSPPSDVGLDESPIVASNDENEPLEPVELTVFDKKLQRKQELENLRQKVRNLHEQKMFFTADGIVASQEHLGDRLFGTQELMKLEEFKEDTTARLQDMHALANSLNDDIDRIGTLLTLSSTYRHFKLYEEAANIHNEAARIAFDITDNAEER